MRYPNKLSTLALFPFLVLLLGGCGGIFCGTETYTYTETVPVYVQKSEMDKVESRAPRDIKEPGKIYLHGTLILINEVNEGVHILDNSDPKNPVPLSFIAIPGNHDLLVREDETGRVLYADNYTDLVAIDLSDPQEVSVMKRVEDVFVDFYPQPVDEEISPEQFLTGYEEGREITETYRDCGGFVEDSPVAAPAPSPGNGGGEGASQGGSLARFAALENFLYAVNGDEIQSFRLESLDNPVVFNSTFVDFGIETLFVYGRESGDQLYVGGNQGMYIMDASDPENLRKEGEITHVQSCDPVVVQGNLAYVTLRGSCFGQSNRLEIIDVSDARSPELIVDYALQEPYGLGVDGDYLFVCDGAAGLKVYENARDPKNLDLIMQLDEVKARDIIPFNDIAIVIAENGFFQYDYSNLAQGEMTLLSSILVAEE